MSALTSSREQTLADALRLTGPDALFPWQRRLLSCFLRGEVPPSLDIPTGLGKTAVMAIWLVARACGAPLPRRLVYVVDRRAVVDQATAVAEDLRAFVGGTTKTNARLGLRDRPLPISTLRGQHVDNREWLEDPVAPAIIVGTVDMIGSRLLFQGYGVTSKMRPYQAALLGVDALVVLDEAHLIPPFEKLLERVARGSRDFGPRGEARQGLIPPLRLMSLSATGRSSSGEPFRLGPADFSHKEAKLRLDATKRVRLRTLAKDDSLVDALTEKAWEFSDGGKRPVRCIVFCDRRADATKCKQKIDKRAKKEGVAIGTELFVGARRVRERTVAAQRLESLGFLAGKKTARTKPSFLFATSAGEVGVDLDSDCVACDLVAWERMVQRLGRVNRRGDVPDGAEVVVFAKSPEPGKIAEHLVARRKALELLPPVGGGAVDASPGAILRLIEGAAGDGHVAQTIDRATTQEPRRPELSRALVEAWAMTSLEDHPGRPKVGPWLRGWTQEEPETRVLWRTHLPVRGPDATAREVDDFFAVAPPHLSEVLEAETSAIVDWLIARAQAVSAGSDGASELEPASSAPPIGRDDIVAVTLTRAGKHCGWLRLQDLIPPPGKPEEPSKDELKQELIGLTVVLDARLAGLTEEGFLDHSFAAAPPTVDGAGEWLEAPRVDDEPPPVRFRVRSFGADQFVSGDAHWQERLRFAAAMSDEGEVIRWLTVERWREVAKRDGGPLEAPPPLLEDHLGRVEKRARELANGLQIPEDYERTLLAAARLHDQGKAAPRWQRAAKAPDATKVYAKPFGSMNQALLDGYRHELGTLIRVEQDELLTELDEDLRDLGLHLIAAHHGFARPVISVSGCDDAPPSVLQRRAAEVARRYARLQERWGPWALAWWEALLRAADQQASRDSDADPEVGSV